MSEGVEMIAGAVVKHVAGILSKKAWERIELMWNFKEDAQEMENKMIDMKVALNYADKCSRGTDNAMVQHWLKKYKLSAYDIEDTLDELEADEMIWKNSQCTFLKSQLDRILYGKLYLIVLDDLWEEGRYNLEALMNMLQSGNKDHDCLIRQWIALGFIQDSDGQPLQNIGREYVDKFLGMSFLTVLNSPTVPAARILKPTLKLRMHDMVHDLTIPLNIGCLLKLQYFDLSGCANLYCHNLGKLPDCIDNLSKLEYLNMTSCSKLEHLPSSIGQLQLKSLDIQGCFSLYDLPDSISNMSTINYFEATLSSVDLVKFERLREHLQLQGSSLLDVRNNDLWSQIVGFEKTQCHELEVEGLENVKHLEETEQAKLSNNLRLTKLILNWQHDEGSLVEDADAMADKLVLEKLVPPRNLQHFDLWGYMDTDFPRWMLDIPYYLPNLITILSDLKGCNHIPPLGQLPNLRALTMAEMPNIKSVGREFYGDHGSCQKLRMIILESMDNLEEWWTTRSSNEEEEFLIPNLHVLSASDCPKLKFLPYPPRSMTWGVQNSDHVLPEHGFGNLSCVTSPFALAIMGASSSEVWRRAAQCIPSIEHLYLDTITGLRTLPGDIQCFTSLRTLSIEDCGDLETLPEWLGDLISLREFRTSRCQKLSALPESIQRLTELKKLQILDCLALSEKCQGEDRHKITHIPEVIFE
ncbi:hypothetical protein PR202_gb03810 [Eleusine coracana subsp. coracana]|uniref:Uncharacterized protein n=1 Tax=Eleusine coracana subsp. coracana TaxID=191504 RepID=A0AAV5E2Y3_ELECO|nr:hypothetical protein PR202_gb03810 [Eleusine coracana subsp. coracana]